MKREARKKVSLLIIIAVMILTVTGCGDKKEESKQTSSEAVQESQSTSEDESQSTGNEEQESTFDFSQAFDNVEVNDKKVPFPFTLNDLGEDFTVEAVTEMGDGRCCGTIYYKNSMVAGAYMNINNKEEFNRKTKINSIDLSHSNTQLITINGLDCNNNVEDIRNSYFGLEEVYDKNNNISFMRKYSGEDYISYFLNEDGTICKIYMGKGE